MQESHTQEGSKKIREREMFAPSSMISKAAGGAVMNFNTLMRIRSNSSQKAQFFLGERTEGKINLTICTYHQD